MLFNFHHFDLNSTLILSSHPQQIPRVLCLWGNDMLWWLITKYLCKQHGQVFLHILSHLIFLTKTNVVDYWRNKNFSDKKTSLLACYYHSWARHEEIEVQNMLMLCPRWQERVLKFKSWLMLTWFHPDTRRAPSRKHSTSCIFTSFVFWERATSTPANIFLWPWALCFTLVSLL